MRHIRTDVTRARISASCIHLQNVMQDAVYNYSRVLWTLYHDTIYLVLVFFCVLLVANEIEALLSWLVMDNWAALTSIRAVLIIGCVVCLAKLRKSAIGLYCFIPPANPTPTPEKPPPQQQPQPVSACVPAPRKSLLDYV